MDYGTQCTMVNGACDMGQSAVNAAESIHSFFGVPYSSIEITPSEPKHWEACARQVGQWADMSTSSTLGLSTLTPVLWKCPAFSTLKPTLKPLKPELQPTR